MQKTEDPEILYKYYNLKRMDFFETKKVRFSQLSALNDPFEFVCNVNIEELRGSLIKISNKSTSLVSLFLIMNKSFFTSFVRNDKFIGVPIILRALVVFIAYPFCLVALLFIWPFIKSNFKKIAVAMAEDFIGLIEKFKTDILVIFCCSEKWNSVPMWAHYADNHKGFCLGIDPKTCFDNLSERKKSSYMIPKKVSYVKEAPILSKRTLNKINFIFTKMDDWSYENEWRFVAFPEESKNRILLDDGKELVFFDVNICSLKEVIIGIDCNIEIAKDIFYKSKKMNSNIDIYQIEKSTGYGFSRKKIEIVEDLVDYKYPSGPMKGFREDMVPQSMSALQEMISKAREHKILNRIID